MQIYGLSPVWFVIWRFSADKWLNALEVHPLWCFFSPVQPLCWKCVENLYQFRICRIWFEFGWNEFPNSIPNQFSNFDFWISTLHKNPNLHLLHKSSEPQASALERKDHQFYLGQATNRTNSKGRYTFYLRMLMKFRKEANHANKLEERKEIRKNSSSSQGSPLWQ